MKTLTAPAAYGYQELRQLHLAPVLDAEVVGG